MRSSNAPFTEYGFSEVIRDVEYLFLLMTQLGTNDLNGQAALTADQTVGDSGSSPGIKTAASECLYATFPGASIPDSTLQIVPYNLGLADTPTAYSGGAYTAPVAGAYQVTASLDVYVSGTPTMGAVLFYLTLNGANITVSQGIVQNSITPFTVNVSASASLRLSPGDRISAFSYVSTDTGAATQSSGGTLSILGILD